MVQRTCATCDAPVSEPKQRRCNRCKWATRSRASCVYCGEPTGYPASSGREASHPACRPFEHGTVYGYRRRKCRCDSCRAAWGADCRRYQTRSIVCSWCGKQSTVTGAGARFCSTSCSRFHIERQRRETTRRRRLPVLHPSPSVDGPSCRVDPSKLLPARRSEWWTMFVSGPCAWCGESFTGLASSAETAPRYCGRRCLGAAGRMAHRERHGRFDIPRRRRLAIYERDGWTCQLCQEPVDPDATDEWRATLDHIVPQSHQLIPDHSDANLRLTHLWCNSIRQDNKIPDEWFAA